MSSPTRSLRLRPVTQSDVPRLVEMNHAAYPDLVEEGVVWEADQLRGHLAIFPEGQILAEWSDGGPPMGAISTLIVGSTPDPLAQHTWYEITDRGRFSNHDPLGSTLYLADVYVDPSAWGKGVGAALYKELFALCRRLGLSRVVAGGRLWGYAEYAPKLSPQEYIARVLAGTIRDRVLNSQLAAGFRVEGVLDGYLQDARSGSYASLLVWNDREART